MPGFLFNDLLIYTTVPNARGFCKCKYSLPLHDMELADVSNTDKVAHAFEIKGSVKSFVVMASSAADKLAWMTAIQQTKDALVKNSSTLKLIAPPGTTAAAAAGVTSPTASPPPAGPRGSHIHGATSNPPAAASHLQSRGQSYLSGSGTLPMGFKLPEPRLPPPPPSA